jgi:hypothetical protein
VNCQSCSALRVYATPSTTTCPRITARFVQASSTAGRGQRCEHAWLLPSYLVQIFHKTRRSVSSLRVTDGRPEEKSTLEFIKCKVLIPNDLASIMLSFIASAREAYELIPRPWTLVLLIENLFAQVLKSLLHRTILQLE